MHDFLVIDNLAKQFGAQRAVDGVSLSIARGEIFSLLGPSGCGKTTLLRLLAGFEQPDGGRLLLEGRDITRLPPERRPVNTVFQNYALFPHLDVRENIAFGLRMARRPAAQIRAAVDRMLGLVQLDGQADKRPAQLSGGQRQRVAIARALVNEPQVLLLDEPLAALDLKLRQHLLAELQALHRQVGTTFIYVTHDQGEALSLSHRIAVMHAGRVEQMDEPRRLYERPATAFVAGFIGDANFLAGEVAETLADGRLRVRLHGLGEATVSGGPGLQRGDRVRVMLRPEHLQLAATAPAGAVNHFPARLRSTGYFGTHLRQRVECGGQSLQVQARTGAPPFSADAELWLHFAPEEARLVEPSPP